MRELRQRLGMMIKAGTLEKKLLNGELHSGGNLDQELIEDLSYEPMRKAMTTVFGDDYSDDELPDLTFDLLLSVLTKRFTYMATKSVKETVKAQKQTKRNRRRFILLPCC